MVVRLVMPSALVPGVIVLWGLSGGMALSVNVSDASRSGVSTAALMLPCLATCTSNQYVPSAQPSFMPKLAGVNVGLFVDPAVLTVTLCVAFAAL